MVEPTLSISSRARFYFVDEKVGIKITTCITDEAGKLQVQPDQIDLGTWSLPADLMRKMAEEAVQERQKEVATAFQKMKARMKT